MVMIRLAFLCLSIFFCKYSVQLESKAYHLNIFTIKQNDECPLNISLAEYIMENKLLQYEDLETVSAAIEISAAIHRYNHEPNKALTIYHLKKGKPLNTLNQYERRDEVLGVLTLQFFFHRSNETFLDRLSHKMYQISLAFDTDSMTDVIDNDLLPNNKLLDFAKEIPCIVINPLNSLEQFPPVYVIPNDPYVFPSSLDMVGQWYLGGRGVVDLYQPFGAKIMQAWGQFRGEVHNIKIAIIGPGCSTHPDLQYNYWNHIKDIRQNVTGEFDHPLFANNEPKEAPWGTPVAGLIGATTNNNFGGAGICWGCQIICLKVYNSNGQLNRLALERALDWVITSDVRALYLGYTSTEYSIAEAIALETLAANDVLVVAPAGNLGCDLDEASTKPCTNGSDESFSGVYPAYYDGETVIVVGSTEMDGTLSKSSNYGNKKVHIMAPGSKLLLPANVAYAPFGYQDFSGTEFAAAVVTGVAGLMFSQNPNLTAAEVKTFIIESAQQLSHLNGKSVSGGIIDAYNAMKKIKRGYVEDEEPSKYPYPEFDVVLQMMSSEKLSRFSTFTLSNLIELGIILIIIIMY